ncbi:MAG: T9SS type A sorting domain-containing protein, partial [Bacteroidota bacterium]
LSVTFHSLAKQPIHVTLVDGTGKEVATKGVAGVQGVNVIQFSNLQALATGMYMLRMVTADGVMQYKLLKAGD